MAGFQVSINGRFWVSTEGTSSRAVLISPDVSHADLTDLKIVSCRAGTSP